MRRRGEGECARVCVCVCLAAASFGVFVKSGVGVVGR